MPLTAPDRIILPEQVPGRQSQNQPIAITASKQRCDYRREVIRDKRLSPWARLLYVDLDDMAGLKAEAWTHQDTLAERFASQTTATPSGSTAS
jgi:hypothetical protein